MRKRKVPEPVATVRKRVGILAVGAAIAAAGLVWGVVFLVRLPDPQLDRFSDIGQAFGIASTLFAAAALIGVMVSVMHQNRQNLHYRNETWHAAHSALLFRVIDEPALYGPCISDPGQFESEDEMRRYYFTTLWLNFGQVGLRTGSMTEQSIREEMCDDMFASPVARELWKKRRTIAETQYGGLSSFQRIVDQEFERSTVVHAALGEQQDDQQRSLRRSRREYRASRGGSSSRHRFPERSGSPHRTPSRPRFARRLQKVALKATESVHQRGTHDS